MNKDFNLFKQGAISGLHKGWNGFLWMMKIIIPVSFATMLLAWSGWLHYLDVVLKPAMGIINLPAAAALPLIIGMLTGIYGGIAAMVALPLTTKQMTLIGIFLLTAHNLIQEGIIQGKSGINHSLIEDTLLLVALGLSAFWLYVPRLLMAVVAVHILKLSHNLINCQTKITQLLQKLREQF